MRENILRPHAEQAFAEEINNIIEFDNKPRPENWKMSPWGVLKYLMGGKLDNGVEISQKYFGNSRLMEVAIATLATDRALLLIGVPGTAKTWVSEHMAAAISGDSTLLIQGTAGMNEDAIRYSWNYAKLLSEGPTFDALVESPIVRAMKKGSISRIEELTRIPSDVQDTLITILSEKTLPIPELNSEFQGTRGFNLIATANDRDKGVNELSSALRRRFNTVVLPLPATLDEEVLIVKNRVDSIGKSLQLPVQEAPMKEIKRLVTIFRELRSGKTIDNKQKLKSPSSTLSTAEAISVINNGQALAAHFGNGLLNPNDLAASLIGAVIKDPTQDKIAFEEYLSLIKDRPDFKGFYSACKNLM